MNSQRIPRKTGRVLGSWGRWIVMMTLLAIIGSVPGWSQESQPVIDPTFRLGVGDVIAVVTWKEPDLSSSVPIRPDGLVSLPLIGEVVAAGQTPESLRQEIEKRMGQFVKAPTVSVVVKEINSLMVYVLGEVGGPGAFIEAATGYFDFVEAVERKLIREINGGPSS